MVLDYKRDRSADTGGFELICRQNAVGLTNSIGLSMQVKGQGIPTYPLSPLYQPVKKNRPSSHAMLPTISSSYKICRDEDEVGGVEETSRGKKLAPFNAFSFMFINNKNGNNNNSNSRSASNSHEDAADGKNHKSKKRKEMKKGMEIKKKGIQEKKIVKINQTNISDQHITLQYPRNKNSLQNNVLPNIRKCKNEKDGEKKEDSRLELKKETNLKADMGKKNVGTNKEGTNKEGRRREVIKEVTPREVVSSTAPRIREESFTTKMDKDCSCLEEASICDKISFYIQQFEQHTQDKLLSCMRLSSTNAPNKKHAPAVGNWSAFKATTNKEHQRLSSFDLHESPPTQLPLKKLHHRTSSHLLRHASIETTSTHTLLRLTLKGTKILMT